LWRISETISAVCTAVCETCNNLRELFLQTLDALLNDCIWFMAANTLDLEVESVWNGIVIEWLALLSWFLPFGILALRPEKFSRVSNTLEVILTIPQ
jgi:hypothetical protein